jgi:esterase/lipase superfamily enzyme
LDFQFLLNGCGKGNLAAQFLNKLFCFKQINFKSKYQTFWTDNFLKIQHKKKWKSYIPEKQITLSKLKTKANLPEYKRKGLRIKHPQYFEDVFTKPFANPIKKTKEMDQFQ